MANVRHLMILQECGMMNNCEDCKHFRIFFSDEHYSYGFCESPKTISLAFRPPEDGLYYSEWMLVGDKFGCVNWETKDE